MMGEQVGGGGRNKADFRSCCLFPCRHWAMEVNAEKVLLRWSGKSLQRENQAANAEESRELEADQRLELGKGLPQVAGRAHLKGISQHISKVPSP